MPRFSLTLIAAALAAIVQLACAPNPFECVSDSCVGCIDDCAESSTSDLE